MPVVQSPSPNFDARPVGVSVDMLVLHYTGMQTAEAALSRMCDAEAKVSAHYMIDEAGAVFQLVDEASRAWHAGVAYWAGATDINARSIGIELVNPGHEFGYVDFSEAQIVALEGLCAEILARHPISPTRVLGHSDVAPARKQDPGERFPWPRLAQKGIGVWHRRRVVPPPHAVEGDLPAILERLESIGYANVPATEETARDIIAAFQRHWLPEAIGTAAEGQGTVFTLAAAAEVSAAMRRARINFGRAS